MPWPTDSQRAATGPPPSESPETPHVTLGDMFARTVTALGRPLALDHAELVLLDDTGSARVLTLRGGEAEPLETTITVPDYSERLWPAEHSGPRVIADAAAGLDGAHAGDQRLLDGGARVLAVIPLAPEGRRAGVLILASRDAAGLAEAHLPTLVTAGEFLVIAHERERLWTTQQVRHRRRVALEGMLAKIAESLDVRKVFVELSGVIREVIPHDVLAFALLLPDRSGVRVQAATHMGVMDLPEYQFSTPEEALDANWRFLLAYDLEPVDAESVRARISPRGAPLAEVVTRPGPQWMKFITQARVRSTMRVPIRLKDHPIGGVAFMSRAADAFDAEDGVVASRIADQLALALAHQELADEARRIAVAEERAQALEQRVDQLSRELDRFSAHKALGQSAAWKKALTDVTQVAGTDTTVLVTGGSGTGKEVIARYIHRGSPRATGGFVALNCAALPEQLLESELFGHERGAFTGAVEARPGKIEQAAGGVLFLDEVGEMSPSVQAKFLRVLQEREYQRLGGTRTLKADVRVLAATNRNLKAAIAQGTFREDLYYRLAVFDIALPPLRERPEDIPVLVDAFLEEIARSVGRPAAGVSEEVRDALVSYAWPGNVRELRNALERAVILCEGGLVTSEHLPLGIASAPPAQAAPLVEAGGQSERDRILEALARTGNNQSKAARLLGLTRAQIRARIEKHGISVDG